MEVDYVVVVGVEVLELKGFCVGKGKVIVLNEKEVVEFEEGVGVLVVKSKKKKKKKKVNFYVLDCSKEFF